MNRGNLKLICSIAFIAIVSAVVLAACKSSTSPDETTWQLVWQDEFNGAINQLPDSTRWGFGIGTDWGNGQLEFDTKRPENASLDGAGNLLIRAIKESYKGQSYTSARISTKGLYQFTYGRVEARMKLPLGQGIWPAFWMLGANDDSVTWPSCGEIDIMELQGQTPSRIYGSVHGPGYSGSKSITKPYNLINDRFDNGFHTFAVEWGSNYVKYFVDNVLYQTITNASVPGAWVYDHPFYIILNLAVGGGYVGSPGATTNFPQTMQIDYVRVYKAAQ